MKKTLTGLAVLAMAAAPSTALAGEITGTGTLKTVKGASECAYSGLNDGYFDGTEAQRVQSYGQVLKSIPKAFRPKGVPGTACNPTRAVAP